MAELTDERIMELAIECGIGHTVIDADLAYAMGVELGTRHIVDDVEPGDTIAFARAIASEVADQGEAEAWQWRKRVHAWTCPTDGPQFVWTEWEALQPPFMDARQHAKSDPVNYELRPLYTRPAAPGWKPIETAPKDGRTLLLGLFNACGKWRTMRGQWFSEAEIAESWEEPDDQPEGWYETAVEPDPPNCWFINPTHWMYLPAAPSPKGDQE